MATKLWVGNAVAVAQVDDITPANVEVGDIFTVTINGKSVSYTAVAATVADVTAGLVAALNLSTIQEFAEITWADATTKLTATADTAGKPFTLTTSTTNGGAADTQTLTRTASVANAGPNVWDTPNNWDGGVVPITGDDVIIGTEGGDILYGLDQSAVTLLTLTILQGFANTIGLPETNADSSTEYPEYRDTYLKVGATDIVIGTGAGNGSSRIKINTGAVQTTMLVKNSGQSSDDAVPAILWKGTHASNAVNINRGDVGIAVLAGETATVKTLRTSFISSIIGDVTLRCGSGTMLNGAGSITIIAGGTISIESDTLSISQTEGDLTLDGSSAHAELDMDGGNCHYNTDGTLTQGKVGSDAELDCSQDIRSRTFTDLELHEGSTFKDPNKTVTFTNPIQLPRTGVEKLKELVLGDHYTIQRGTLA